jgi:hypothetical protein
LVPAITSSTIVTAAITRAANRASPNESTRIMWGTAASASTSVPASTSRTSRKPETSVNGRRSAATIGGSTALKAAISAATTNAPPASMRRTPGTRAPAAKTAPAATSQAKRSRQGRTGGFEGRQTTSSP